MCPKYCVSESLCDLILIIELKQGSNIFINYIAKSRQGPDSLCHQVITTPDTDYVTLVIMFFTGDYQVMTGRAGEFLWRDIYWTLKEFSRLRAEC